MTTNQKARNLFTLSASLALVAAAAPGLADELYSQPDGGTPAWSSQDARNDGGLGWFSEAADNFPGEADWVIEDMVWYGSYSQPKGMEGNTDGFTIRFYDDDNGDPGDLLYEEDILGVGTNLSETYLFDWTSDLAYYRYEAELPADFDVPADGQFWVSIVAILDRGGGADEPQWFIGTAPSVTPPAAHSWFFDPGNFEEQNRDMAFTLNGSVGEPCPPDINGDGEVTSADFLAYIDAFAAGDDVADFDGDGMIDSSDFLAYIDAFAAGCP